MTTKLKDSGIYPVGIGYKAQQGKDSFAKAIQLNDPSAIAIYSFSRDVLFPVARWLSLMGQEKEPETLQHLAQTWISVDPGHIIQCLEYCILDEPAPIVIVPGIREYHQLEWIKSNGGMMIELKRVYPDGTQFAASDRNLNHPSETQLDNYAFDYTITIPDGDLEQLQEDANGVYKLIRQRFE
jgi:hypothetical protein